MGTCQNTQMSKTLSWLLRHGAHQERMPIGSDGYLPVESILQYKYFRGKYSLKDIEDVVRNDTKNRFAFRTNNATGILEIRANQGHSMSHIDDLELTPITSSAALPNGWVVHGTYRSALPEIQQHGLCRMSRNHIHFCPYEPEDSRVISGLRQSAQILVYINVDKAITDGIKFYKSANDVILSEGNACGFIEPKYFLKIMDKKTGGDLL